MQILWIARKAKRWILDQIKSGFSLEAKIIKLSLMVLWMSHEKARVTGNDNNARKSRRH